MAIDSKMNRLLELRPEHIHDRSGVFMGSKGEIEKVLRYHKKAE